MISRPYEVIASRARDRQRNTTHCRGHGRCPRRQPSRAKRKTEGYFEHEKSATGMPPSTSYFLINAGTGPFAVVRVLSAAASAGVRTARAGWTYCVVIATPAEPDARSPPCWEAIGWRRFAGHVYCQRSSQEARRAFPSLGTFPRTIGTLQATVNFGSVTKPVRSPKRSEASWTSRGSQTGR